MKYKVTRLGRSRWALTSAAAWKAALKRGQKPADLMSGQEREKAYYAREGITGRFIPMRSTWLNGDRHLAEYEVDDGMAEVRKRVAARQKCKEVEGNEDN